MVDPITSKLNPVQRKIFLPFEMTRRMLVVTDLDDLTIIDGAVVSPDGSRDPIGEVSVAPAARLLRLKACFRPKAFQRSFGGTGYLRR
jgi:hypothetical protein